MNKPRNVHFIAYTVLMNELPLIMLVGCSLRRYTRINVLLGQTPDEIINMNLVYITIISKLNAQQFWFLLFNPRDEKTV